MEMLLEHTFTYKGYKCVIIKIVDNYDLANFQEFFPKTYYCGYVQVSRWHPAFEKDYNDVHVKCHGGLTYSSHYLLDLHYPGWWLGFDCGHVEDYFEPKDANFCINQCKDIVDQLKEMGE